VTSGHRPKIVVADPIHPDGVEALRELAEVAYLPQRQGLAEETDAVILVVRAPVTEAVLARMPRLRAVIRCGAGIDGIPAAYAAARGIAVANTPGANANGVAEFVFAALMQVSRNVSGLAEAACRGDWLQRNAAREDTFELEGLRIGIVGMGSIGQRIAEIAHRGFGMTVRATVHTPRVLPAHVEPVDVDALFRTSDAVVLCCSLNDATRGMIGERHLRSLPDRAVLVNVARAAVIDRKALVDFALDAQRRVALVLDVHYDVPLPAGHPLCTAHRCWLTPHVAGMTADSERRMGLATARVAARWLTEAPPG
jgi:D-3-phosphoglycerate dehydrogenase / 2-oxoglutarate reductase